MRVRARARQGCDAVRTVLATNGHRRPRAVAVGFEPTVESPPHTLSSSANPRSGTVVHVHHVVNMPVRGCHRTPRTTTNETRTGTRSALASSARLESQRPTAPMTARRKHGTGDFIVRVPRIPCHPVQRASFPEWATGWTPSGALLLSPVRMRYGIVKRHSQDFVEASESLTRRSELSTGWIVRASRSGSYRGCRRRSCRPSSARL